MAMFTGGYDCIIIPQGSRQADGADLIGSEFCGRGLFTIAMFPSTTAATMATFATICCKYLYVYHFFLLLSKALFQTNLRTAICWGWSENLLGQSVV